jgi:hydroxymethylbilane synthase
MTNPTNKVIIGTRGSKLALAQAKRVQKLLNISSEIKIIKTSGDIHENKAIADMGGKGVFSTQIEQELLDSKIDIAVHSLKDLPGIMTEGLVINGVVERNDPRDVLIGNIKKGSKVGTSSPRRTAQLKYKRKDIEVLPIRGNIDTRLKKLQDGQYDAIILAKAGLQMLGLENKVDKIYELDEMMPCAGQGIIAIQTRDNDDPINNLITKINHLQTFYQAEAERSLLEAIGGDCHTALGCYTMISAYHLYVSSEMYVNDKKYTASGSGNIIDAKEVGNRIGKDLLKQLD